MITTFTHTFREETKNHTQKLNGITFTPETEPHILIHFLHVHIAHPNRRDSSQMLVSFIVELCRPDHPTKKCSFSLDNMNGYFNERSIKSFSPVVNFVLQDSTAWFLATYF